ncbi:von Willebrand factor A domain-containing protein 8 [Hondaea fermentalgiana]|uniref:von Willebrand factor A domain-containing protein 8 n=1 Tax=Hondaea fermentalgiana TaxID=2315210 RepID=A0A2R5G256_9STRA|nr:von Willebrand factor A domain-containing protein 8 [Hondaea fermentalgiana]|eukprot:GBG24399.1 von Willebrand factor A domain-containing protein 8 [Hondaea fermentalgiana]
MRAVFWRRGLEWSRVARATHRHQTRVVSTETRNEPRVVTIGDVTHEFAPAQDLARVPQQYHRDFGAAVSQTALGHLRWMLQKDKLGQDMFLMGTPGPSRRWLALRYAELTQREVEYVSISRDTTESDLKQRREIVGGSALFEDQAPVRAALHGRLLIIDGIEKAERNVLPTLNNLLENREMQLEDGRFLMDPARYEELKDQVSMSDTQKHIVPSHKDFRVIALGVPVPPFRGKPLDPPLRSRFQVRVVEPASGSEVWPDLVHAVSSVDANVSAAPADHPRLVALTSAAGALRMMEESWNAPPGDESVVQGMPHFPESTLPQLSVLVHSFPEDAVATPLARAFPFFGTVPGPKAQETVRKTCSLLLKERASDLLQKKQMAYQPQTFQHTRYTLANVVPNKATGEEEKDTDNFLGTFAFESPSGHAVELQGHVGPQLAVGASKRVELDSRPFHAIDEHEMIMSAMAQDHCVGRDVVLLGEPGSGKSRLAEHFSERLGYQTTLFSLYKDMSARDLLQRRTTDSQGNTGWEYSPLVNAAIRGEMLILDGIDRVDPETLTVIQRLVCDREAELFDGKLLRAVGAAGASNNADQREGKAKATKVVAVHPRFRIVALATTGSTKASQSWLNADTLAMFSVHHLNHMSPADHETIVRACLQNVPGEFLALLRDFSAALLEDRDHADAKMKKPSKDDPESEAVTKAASMGVRPLSLRQVMRLCRFADAFPTQALPEMRERLRTVLLGHFLPHSQYKALEELMDRVGIPSDQHGEEELAPGQGISIESSDDYVCIGEVRAAVKAPEFPELVPAPVFFDIPKHRELLRDMLEDVVSGEHAKHLLLIGNQGVGKNKLADRLLQLMQKEREYIQLHRDSTVGSLTLSPSLRDGIVVWDDSPLVRAAVRGRALMVDEVDKAPLEVVSVLKSLVEDGELLLADGRRLVSQSRYAAAERLGTSEKLLPLHADFMMVVLANRPGFPFLGNHVFREIGDIFSAHVIPNPDAASELELLQAYAPTVDRGILAKLVGAFSELRSLVDDGVLVYPFSTREAVAVAKHLETFPTDGLVNTLENVLGFDTFDPQTMDVIVGAFQRHGIPYVSARTRKNDPSASRYTIAVSHPEDLAPPFATEEWTSRDKN